ncbi:5061_t:CDS:2 [Dentiscutata erythropus]|uniref:5061_t:CDS:1 n=1 Tax=Dentiscutata erythropus TaxID=1348616 RepID=A0A9N8VYR1_9GLOM|nr:5061_t:CDS:2 [Dentiscutata erythropus]
MDKMEVPENNNQEYIPHTKCIIQVVFEQEGTLKRTVEFIQQYYNSQTCRTFFIPRKVNHELRYYSSNKWKTPTISSVILFVYPVRTTEFSSLVTRETRLKPIQIQLLEKPIRVYIKKPSTLTISPVNNSISYRQIISKIFTKRKKNVLWRLPLEVKRQSNDKRSTTRLIIPFGFELNIDLNPGRSLINGYVKENYDFEGGKYYESDKERKNDRSRKKYLSTMEFFDILKYSR